MKGRWAEGKKGRRDEGKKEEFRKRQLYYWDKKNILKKGNLLLEKKSPQNLELKNP